VHDASEEQSEAWSDNGGDGAVQDLRAEALLFFHVVVMLVGQIADHYRDADCGNEAQCWR